MSPSVKKLVLDENEIGKVELKSNSSLRFLSLNKNKLKSCENFQRLYELEVLSLQENVFEVEEAVPKEDGADPEAPPEMAPVTYAIKSLEGLENLPKLKKLMLQGNKIETLDHLPDLPCLEELYLDANGIAELSELKKLAPLKNLKVLSMAGNPCAEGDNFSLEVLILLMDELPCLKMIGETPVDKEAIDGAKAERKQRAEDAAVKAKEEEEARLAAEAEGKGAAEGEEAAAE